MKYVVPLDPFSWLGVDTHEQSFMSESMVLVELAKSHFKSAELASNFVKEATIERVLSDASHNGVLKACLLWRLSDACFLRKLAAQDLFSQFLEY